VATEEARGLAALSVADEQLLRELAERARAGELKFTGEGGLPGKVTKMVIEGAWLEWRRGHQARSRWFYKGRGSFRVSCFLLSG
jgi:hypothetical protein